MSINEKQAAEEYGGPGAASPSLAAFSENMWRKFAQLSQSYTGPQVVEALHYASDVVYSAGLDGALEGIPLDDSLAIAFNFTWMTAVFLKLQSMPQK